MILPLLILSTAIGISTAYLRPSLEDPAVHHVLERIVIDQAGKVNRTADENAAYCLVRLPWQLRFTITDEDELALRMELDDYRRSSTSFNSSEDMMSHFQTTPIGYSIYQKLNAFVEGKMKEFRFGTEATAFVKSLERSQLYLAAWAYNELAHNYQGPVLAREGKTMIRKAVSAYWALSETAKNDVEKMWCIRTFHRSLGVLESTGNIRYFMRYIRDILRD